MRAAPARLLFCFRRRSSRLLSSGFFAVVCSETCGVLRGGRVKGAAANRESNGSYKGIGTKTVAVGSLNVL